MTLKIGIVGTGNMGRIHARVLNNQRSLAAVADLDAVRARAIADIYGVRAFDNIESMLDEMNLDGIIISTPTSTHASIAKMIAEKYDVKGILIEKPLASTYKDAKHVAELLKRKNIKAIVSHSEIYNPVVDRALSLIHDGAVGDIRTVIHDRRGFVPPKRIPSLGDIFEDIGVHDFDIMARVSSGSATLYAQCITEQGVYNSATVIVKFKSGKAHVFHLSRQYVGRKRSMDVSGTKGTLSIDLFGQIIKVQDLDKAPSADSRTINLPERGATIKVYGEPVGEVISDFIKIIETDSQPRVSLDDGVAALKVVEAARESAKLGRIVDVEIQARG
ncbi:MAG: Gfo/Idh/MocA family oxidoreductase [Candidatus Thorarchaeota archaeon]|nr:Gfo/Idh/MocA family oxidoreductase [Candidatus Thorarchaeota archaeon]